LYRRIPAQRGTYIVWNETNRQWQISSLAFRNLDEQLQAFSVNLGCVLDELGAGAETVIVDRSRYALVSLQAGFVRQHAQAVERTPEPDDPSHGPVAQWVIVPPDWPWPPPER
jgi:hypothetical protein